MHRFRRHTIPRLLPALVFFALLAACATASIASATTSAPAGLGGTWSGSYSGCIGARSRSTGPRAARVP